MAVLGRSLTRQQTLSRAPRPACTPRVSRKLSVMTGVHTTANVAPTHPSAKTPHVPQRSGLMFHALSRNHKVLTYTNPRAQGGTRPTQSPHNTTFSAKRSRNATPPCAHTCMPISAHQSYDNQARSKRERTPCVHVDVRQRRPTHAVTIAGATSPWPWPSSPAPSHEPMRPATQAADDDDRINHRNTRRNVKYVVRDQQRDIFR
jgi:hypothetical protein